jgi:putative transposase
MSIRKYNCYSSNLKISAINGESTGVNYNTRYYWENKGRGRIEAAALKDGMLQLINNKLEARDKINGMFSGVFDFFMKFIRGRRSLEKQFKKQRATIVALIEGLKSFSDTMNICNWFGITERTYFNWKSKPLCRTTYTKECPNIIPNQLTDRERRILEQDYFFQAKYSDRSISELYAQTLADKRVIVSDSVFYEFARFLGEDIRRRPIRKKKYKKGLRADKAKQIIHMDRTRFPIANMLNKPAWVSLICDNRSRAILGFNVFTGSHSRYTLANLQETMVRHDLAGKDFWLVTDDGSENKGEVKEYLKLHPNIKHKIAQLNIPYSNSMIEAAIKQLKYRYLKKKEFDTITGLSAAIKIAIEEYNNRPRKIHLGKTPLQVLAGEEQDIWEFNEFKEQNRKRRLEENRQFKCLKISYAFIGN